MHILPSFQIPTASSPLPPNSSTNKPKKKKPKTVKSAMPSTHHPHRSCHCNSSSSSTANYHSLYKDDDPVTPTVIKPAPHPPAEPAHVVMSTPYLNPTATAHISHSPGTAGNPIDMPSNFPTPVTFQETLKHHKQAQGPFSPTPRPVVFLTLLKKSTDSCKTPAPSTPDSPVPFAYICDCSDEEGGYLAAPVHSLKRKAVLSVNASGSSIQANEVIEIFTESESDKIQPFCQLRPFSQLRFCKCLALKSYLSSCAIQQDPNHDIDMDSTPKIPCPSPHT